MSGCTLLSDFLSGPICSVQTDMAVVSFLKSVMCSPESNFLALPMETRALSRTTTISGRDRPGGVRGIECVSLDCTLHNKSERSSCGSDFTPETTRETDPDPG